MARARRTASMSQRVVGVGASAGGIDALGQLFARMPADTGLAFVVLQHLPPSQIGRLAASLATSTELPVIDVETGHRIEPNTVLLVPPRTSAQLLRGELVLRPGKAGARPRQPIDALFRSLAEALGERAIGVVLSGTARDGTEGLRAIQAAGGLSFAQEPSTAQFDEMPRSAIAAGVAETVLPPAQIAKELGAIAKRATGQPRPRERGELARVRRDLTAAMEYLRSGATRHAAVNEELQTANEELQTANEELRTTNEELQTAQEELQSVNHEIRAVNRELQRGSQLLREVNDDLVNVLASVEIAIIIVDVHRRIRRFTPPARAVMKLLPADLGRPLADLQPSVDVPRLDAVVAEVIDKLEVHESEVRHPDGTSYRMQIRPYRTADHAIGGAILAFVDITALRAASDRATAIVETAPTPLAVLDERLRVQSANGAFYRVFAVAPPDAIGRPLLELGQWRAPALRARLGEVVASGIGFEDLEVEHRDTAGERVLRIAANPLPSAGGHRSILIGIADDTARRRLEEAREAANLERAAFLDAVSHELRTPLSAIMLWAQALRDLELDGPRRQQAIDTILESARSEAEIVDDLLELVRSRSATLGVTLESVDPAPIIQAAVDQARGAAGDKQLVIETTIAAGPQINADPRRLKQLTAKLISNAIKFTPPGGKLWVTLAFHDGAMELCIRDTGPGVSPEFLARMFEPFSQANGSRTRTHHGLGIGLALVRYFVERQGGTIDVASPGEGQGTAFTVRLPAPG
jgi:two-component system, chemotaxis family, CheB/CheR fusion protein